MMKASKELCIQLIEAYLKDIEPNNKLIAAAIRFKERKNESS